VFLLLAATAALLGGLLFTFPDAWAADLDFSRVLDTALARSHDLAIARMDTEYKEETVSETVYGFLPTVSLSGTNEYIKDLSGAGVTTVVGESVLTASTAYQDSYSANLRWRLLDFGATFKKYQAAELDAESSKAGLGKAELGLKVQVLHLYRDALAAAKEVDARREMLPLLREAASIQGRLYEAGKVGRVPVLESELRAARADRELRELSMNLSTALKRLTLYTGEDYAESDTALADFAQSKGTVLDWDPARHPEMRQYALAIQSKEAERDMVARSFWPTLDAYYQYNYYGTDPKSYAAARDDVNERSYRVGLTLSVPISEGFRKVHTLRKAELEAAKLREERAKKLEELEQSYLDLKRRYAYYQEDVRMRSAMLQDVEIELAMLTRLLEGQAAGRADYLDQKVALLAQKLDLEKGLVNSAAAQMELEFLAEATR
jgi:outer membrane protein TolC